VYQELGDRYSAIEPPSLAGLFATYLKKRGLSVAIVDNRPCTAGSTWPPLGDSRSRPRKFVDRKPTPTPAYPLPVQEFQAVSPVWHERQGSPGLQFRKILVEL